MTVRHLIIWEDETIQLREVDTFGLGYLQGLLCEAATPRMATVQVVRAPFGQSMYIDEEGKVHGRAINGWATDLARDAGLIGDWIVGPAVIVGKPDAEGNDTSVSDEMIAHVEAITGTDIEVKS